MAPKCLKEMYRTPKAVAFAKQNDRLCGQRGTGAVGRPLGTLLREEVV